MHQERQITVPGNSQKNKRLLGTSFTQYFVKIYPGHKFQRQDE